MSFRVFRGYVLLILELPLFVNVVKGRFGRGLLMEDPDMMFDYYGITVTLALDAV